MSGNKLISIRKIGTPLAIMSALVLAGCDENGEPAFPTIDRAAPNEDTVAAPQSVQLVERDVEAPDAFQVSEAGLWDGRPSLGGVWVAHPDVSEPERVIIRNQANGTFVIGALFRRERDNPGPALQVSSDAANALEMLAGAPAQLQVTALRREEVPTAPQAQATTTFEPPADIAAAPIEATPLDAPAPPADPTPVASVDVPDVPDADVPTPTLQIPDAIATAAAAAIATAEASAEAPATRPTPVAAPAPSTLAKPFIQIGIFSVEANANRTADRMRASGIVPTVLQQESQGRRFWRVIVGPTTSESERADLLTQVKAQGFADAYFVTN